MNRDKIYWKPQREDPEPFTKLEIIGTIVAGCFILLFVFVWMPAFFGGAS